MSQNLTNRKNTLRYTLTVILVTLLLLGQVTSAVAGTISLLDDLYITEQDPFTDLDSSVTVASTSDDWSGGYIDIEITTNGSAADQLQAVSGGLITVSGSAVYYDGDRIGTIDTIRNGVNGNPLRINFSGGLFNASFENGFTGWTVNTNHPGLPGDTPDTDIVQSADIVTTPVFEHSYSARLSILGHVTTMCGTAHGPQITSSPFSAAAGNTVSLNWQAIQTGDNYDVYGYLDNLDTLVTQELFYERGVTTSGWRTTNTTVNSSVCPSGTCNLAFRFLAGTQDATCGLYVGSYLYIDGISVQTFVATDVMVDALVENIQYRNTSDNPPASKDYTLTLVDSVNTGTGFATIYITAVNDDPTDITLSPSSVDENLPIGTLVGNFSTTDPDSSSFTYSLVAGAGDADNASFSIVGGQLFTTAIFDYETKSSYTIRVRTEDDGTPTGWREEEFIITVNNIVDPDIDVSKSGPASVTVSGAATTVTYVVTVLNNGPETASGIVINEALTLPPGVTVQSVTPSGTTTWSDPTWTVGTLANGASAILTVVLDVDRAAPGGTDIIADTASLSALAPGETDPVPGNNSASLSTTIDNIDPIIDGTGADDIWYIHRVGGVYEVWLNGALWRSYIVVTFTDSFTFNGLGGDDSLEVDLSSDPIPGGPVTFNGGAGGNDTLSFTNGSPAITIMNYYFDNENDGRVEIPGAGTVDYTGLDPIASTVTPATVNLFYSNTAETITVQDSGNPGQTQVDSNVGGETVTFNNPTNDLNIYAGDGADSADDIITVNGYGSGYSASTYLYLRGGNDTVNLYAPIFYTWGDSGNDTFNLYTNGSSTWIMGDSGTDYVYNQTAGGFTFNLTGANDGSITGVVPNLHDVDILYGSDTGGDTFNFNSGGSISTIYGRGGDDSIYLNGGYWTGAAYGDSGGGDSGYDALYGPAAGAVYWYFNGANFGSIPVSGSQSFYEMDNLIDRAFGNLINHAAGTTWEVNGALDGRIPAYDLDFTDMDHLIGHAGGIDTFNVNNGGTMHRISGNSGDDIFNIYTGGAISDLIRGNLGNDDFYIYNGATIANRILGDAGDDTLWVEYTSGTRSLNFYGGDGLNDLILLTGSAANGTYNPGPAADEGTVIYNSGGTQTLNFVGVEPIEDDTAAPLFTVNGTAAPNTINVIDGPPIDPDLDTVFDDSLEVNFAGAFELIRLANKTTVDVNGLGGEDVINVNVTNAAPITGLSNLNVDAGAENDTINVTNMDFTLTNTIDGGTELDLLYVDNTANATGDDYTVSVTVVSEDTSGTVDLTYTGVETLDLDTGLGDDTVYATGSPDTEYFLDGMGHIGGDTLVVDAEGNGVHFLDNPGEIDIDGMMTINWTRFEFVDIINYPADLAMNKTALDLTPIAGEQFTYRLTVTNNGPSDAADITITDTLPAETTYLADSASCGLGGLTNGCNIGNLAEDASTSVDVVVLVNADATGQIVNTAFVTVTASTVIEPILTNNTDVTTVTLDTEADLAVTKMSKPDTKVDAGTAFTYTIFVDNYGPSYATSLVLTDTILASGNFFLDTYGDDRGATCNPVGDDLICTLGSLEPVGIGAGTGRWTITLTVTATNTADVNNVVNVVSEVFDPDLSNNQAIDFISIEAVADLEIEKAVDLIALPSSQINAGASAAGLWVITVTNNGPSPAENVVVTDHLPSALLEGSVVGSPDQGSCVPGTPGDPDDPMVCALGDIDSGSSVNITINGVVDPSWLAIQPGTPASVWMDNDVSVSSDTLDRDTGDNYATSNIQVFDNADMGVAKTGPTTMLAGTTDTFTVTVTNSGPSTVRDMTLTDVVEAGLQIQGVSVLNADGNCAISSFTNPKDTLTCDLGDVEPGQTPVLYIEVMAETTVANGTSLDNTAAVTSTLTPEANPGGESSTWSVTVNTLAEMAVTKTASNLAPVPGGQFSYEITIVNNGPSEAANVILTDTIPAGLSYVLDTANCTESVLAAGCNLGTLSVGETAYLEILVDVEALATGAIDNTAYVISDATAEVSDTVRVVVESVADLGVFKTGKPDGVVLAGEFLTYTILVENFGPSYAHSVTVTDTMVSNLNFELISVNPDVRGNRAGVASCTPASGWSTAGRLYVTCRLDDGLEPVGPGDTGRWEIEIVVRADEPQDINNYVTVSSDDIDFDSSNNTYTTQHQIIGLVDLDISKVDLNDPVMAGFLDDLVYILTVGNSGPSTAQDVVVHDNLPADLSVSGVSASQGSCLYSDIDVDCNLGDLAVGLTASVRITATVSADVLMGTNLVNNASVSSAFADSDGTDNSASETTAVESESTLHVSKVDSQDPVAAGNQFEYAFYVENIGPSTAHGVWFFDYIPDELDYLGYEIGNGDGYCLHNETFNSVDCYLNDIAVNDWREVFISVEVLPEAPPGIITNNVVWDADSPLVFDPDFEDIDEETEITPTAVLQISKSALNPTPVPGGQFEYEITVTNNGPSLAYNVTVTDTIPTGLTYVLDTFICGEAQLAAGCNVGDLDPDESVSFNIVVDVDESTTGSLDNTAYATSNVSTVVSDTATIDVNTFADLGIIKIGKPDDVVQTGENLTYTLFVDNYGPSDAHDVEVLDVLLSSGTFTLTSVTADADSNRGTAMCSLSESSIVDMALVYTSTLQPARTAVDGLLTVFALQLDGLATTSYYLDVDDLTSDEPLAAVDNEFYMDTSSVPAGFYAWWAGKGIDAADEGTGTWEAWMWEIINGREPMFYVRVGAGPSYMLLDGLQWGYFGQAEYLRVNGDYPDGTYAFVGSIEDADGDVDPMTVWMSLGAGTVEVPDPAPFQATGRLTVFCELGAALEAGGRWAIEMVVTAAEPQDINNTVRVSNSDVDSNPSNDVADTAHAFVGVVDLEITKTSEGEVYNPLLGDYIQVDDVTTAGRLLYYELTVTNNGPSQARNVVVEDDLPVGVTVFYAQPLGDGQCTFTDAHVDCNLGTLEVGETATIEIMTQVDYDIEVRYPAINLLMIENNASVYSDNADPDNSNNITNALTLVLFRADLQVNKIDVTSIITDVIAGTLMEYRINVSNLGPSLARDVILIDSLPEEVTFVDISFLNHPDAECQYAETTHFITCRLEDLEPLWFDTALLKVTVTPETPDGTLMTNSVTVNSFTRDIFDENNFDEVETTVLAYADLAVSKSAYDQTPVAGRDVTYQISVLNNGPAIARDVIVTDTLPLGTSYRIDDDNCLVTEDSGPSGEDQLTCSLGDLGVGEATSFDVVARLDADILPGTHLLNEVLVTSDITDTISFNDEADADVEVDTEVDVRVLKFGKPDGEVMAGEFLTYTMLVENFGPSFAHSVTVTDTIVSDRNFELISVNPDVRGNRAGAANCTPTSGWSTEGRLYVTCRLDEALEPVGPGDSGRWEVEIVIRANETQDINDIATVSAADFELNWENNTSIAVNEIVLAVSDLEITKSGVGQIWTPGGVIDNVPGQVTAGQRLTYTLSVTNHGPSTAVNVFVHDELPPGLTVYGVMLDPDVGSCNIVNDTYIDCGLDSIDPTAPGNVVTITVVALVNPNVPAGTFLDNNAWVVSDNYDDNNANNYATDMMYVLVASLLDIEKTDEPDPVTAGEVLEYRILVRNDGPSVAENLRIYDDYTPEQALTLKDYNIGNGTGVCFPNMDAHDVDCYLGDIDPGDFREIFLRFYVDPGVQDGTELFNQVSAAADSFPLVDPTADTTETTTVNAYADLEITKSALDMTPAAGEDLTYQITVLNKGPSVATNVLVTDTLPLGVSYRVNDDNCSLAGTLPTGEEVLACSLGDLIVNQSTTFEVVVRLNADILPGTHLLNEVEVSSDITDTVDINNEADVDIEIDTEVDVRVLKFGKPDGEVMAGEFLTYTILVENFGPSFAHSVTVTDTIVSNLNFELISVNPDVRGNRAGAADCTPVSGWSTAGRLYVTCRLDEALEPVGPGDSGRWEIEIVIRANETQDINDIATVSAADFELNWENNTSIAVNEIVLAVSDLEIIKEGVGQIWTPGGVIDNVDGQVTAGQRLTYTLSITNNGPSTAVNVFVHDELPPGLTVYGVMLDPDIGSCNIVDDTYIDCGLDSLDPTAPGNVVTITIIALVNPDVPAGSLLDNNAWVVSDNYDDNNANNYATDMMYVLVASLLDIEKTDEPDPVTAGEVLEYRILVRNDGPSVAENVRLYDTFTPAQALEFQGYRIGNGSGYCFYNMDDDDVDCYLGDVDPGDFREIFLRFRVDPGLTDQTMLLNEVSVTSDSFTLVDPEADLDEETTVEAHADLEVTKQASDLTPVAGDELAYRITVVNNGPSTAYSVVLTDTFPISATYWVDTFGCGATLATGCDLGDMLEGDEIIIDVVVKVHPDTLPGTLLMNRVEVDSETPDDNEDNNVDYAETYVTTIADLRILKYGKPEAPVVETEFITYTLIVENFGPSYAHTVTVSDTLAADGDFTLWSVNPDVLGNRTGVAFCAPMAPPTVDDIGGRLNITCWLTEDLEPVGALGTDTGRWMIEMVVQVNETQSINNIATVTSLDDDPNIGNNLAETAHQIVGVSDMEIVKEAAGQTWNQGVIVNNVPNQVTAGLYLTYTLTITNHGPSVAENVFVHDDLPEGFTVVVATPSEGTCNYTVTEVDCGLDTMEVGESNTITILAMLSAGVPGGTILDNNAWVTSDNRDDNNGNDYANNQTYVSVASEIDIEKTDEPDPVTAGEELEYRILVTNLGPSVAEDVRIFDDLPDSVANALHYQGYEIGNGAGECFYNMDGPDVDCYLGDLLPGAQNAVEIFLRFEVDPSVPDWTVLWNEVSLTADSFVPPAATVDYTETTTVRAYADLEVTKTADDLTPVAGEQLTYQIVVVNNGPSVAPNVTLTDTLPTGVTYLIDTYGCGADLFTGCALGTMAPGDAVTFAVTVLIDPSVLPGTQLDNFVIVRSDVEDPYPEKAEDIAEVYVDTVADLNILKFGKPDGHVDAGELLTYTLIVENFGPSYAHDVMVLDELTSDGVFEVISINSDVLGNRSTGMCMPVDGPITTFTLRNSLDQTNWSSVAGDPVVGFAMELDPLETYYYIDIASLVFNQPLAAGLNPFYLDPASVPVGFWVYWAAKGVDAGAAPLSWQAHMWDILNGIEPQFYLKVDAGPSYSLVDGFRYDFESVEDYLRVNGDYPLGTYAYNGMIEDAGGGFTPMAVDMTFTDTTPVVPDMMPFESDQRQTIACHLGSDLEVVGPSPNQGRWMIEIVVTADETQDINNVATVSSSDYDPYLDNNTAYVEHDIIDISDMEIVKEGLGQIWTMGGIVDNVPAQVTAGLNLTYTLTITNNGPSTAENVYVHDDLPAGLTVLRVTPSQGSCSHTATDVDCGLDRMDPGAGATIEVVAQVGADVPEGTLLENNAWVTSDNFDRDNGNNYADDQMYVMVASELYINKTDAPDPVTAGEVLEYKVEVVNLGPSVARQVRFTDDVPEGLTFAGYDIGNGNGVCFYHQMDHEVECYLGDLEANALRAREVYLRFVVDADTEHETVLWNEVFVNADTYIPFDPTSVFTETTIVWADADLEVIKTADDLTPVAGEQLTYQITVINNGPSTAYSVTLTDTLPMSVTYLLDTYGCGADLFTGCDLGDMAPGDSITFDVKVLVNADVLPGTQLDNLVQVSSDTPDLTPENDEDIAEVYVDTVADLNILKFGKPDGHVDAGELLTYTLIIENFGPSFAHDVMVLDELTSDGVFEVISINSDVLGNRSTAMCMPVDGPITTFTLRNSLDQTNWSSVAGDPVVGFAMELDPLETYYYIDIASLVFNQPLAAGLNPFYLDPASVPVGFWAYWAAKGVDAGAAPLSWQAHMWDILNGIEPQFYLKVDAGPSYSLVDGFRYDFESVEDYLRVNGDYPLGTYAYNGMIEDAGGGFTPMAVDMTFTDTTPVVPDMMPFESDQRQTIACHLGSDLEVVGPSPNQGRWMIEIVVTADETQDINNVATVSSSDYDPYLDNNTAYVEHDIIDISDMEIVKEGLGQIWTMGGIVDNVPAQVTAGLNLTYTLTITNNGPSTAENVYVHDDLPAGLTVLRVTPSQGSCSHTATDVDCGLDRMDPGAGATIEVVAQVGADVPEGTLLENNAWVTSDNFDRNNGNNYADDQMYVMVASELYINKTDAPDPVTAGEVLEYKVEVVNLGPSVARQVRFTDDVPEGLTFAGYDIGNGNGVCFYHQMDHEVECYLGDLEANALRAREVYLRFVVDADTEHETVLWNEVFVNADTYIPFDPTSVFTETTIVWADADLEVIKTADDLTPVAGEQLTYQITVVNNGPSTAYSVTLTDTLPMSVTYLLDTYGCGADLFTGCDLGDMAPGDSITFDVKVLVDADVLPGTQLDNLVQVSSDTPDLTPENDEDIAEVYVDTVADMTILKYGNPSGDVRAGELLTYTLIIENNGPSYAHDVQVLDELTSDGVFEIVSVNSDVLENRSTAVCSPETGTGTQRFTIDCDLGADLESVGPGTNQGRWVIEIVVTAEQTQDITNVATVSSSDYDPDIYSNTDFVEHAFTDSADLGIIKMDDPNAVIAGQTLTYTLVITNYGPSTAENVVVDDDMPVGLTVGSATASQGSCSFTDLEVDCGLGNILPGAGATITIVATVNEDVLEDTLLHNNAWVSSDIYDPDNDNNYAHETTYVGIASTLTVEKTDAPDPVLAGEELEYAIYVRNDGPSMVENLYFYDYLPDEYLTFKGYEIGNGTGNCFYQAAQGRVDCYLDDLDVDDFRWIYLTFDVDSEAPDGTVLDNRVEWFADSPIDPTGDFEEDTTVYAPSVDLSVVKTATPDPVIAGEELVYAVTVANNGLAMAPNVMVTDTLPLEVEYVVDTAGCDLSEGTGPEGRDQVICDLGMINNGSEKNFQIKVKVPADTVANGSLTLTNDLVVTSSGVESEPYDNTFTLITLVDEYADLSIVKVSKPDDFVYAGEYFTYTIIVENHGPSFARLVSIRDEILSDGDFELVSSILDPNREDAGPVIEGSAEGKETIRFDLLEDLEPTDIFNDGRWVIQVVVRANQGQDVDNLAIVFTQEDGTPDPDLSNNKAEDFIHVESSADLEIIKNAPETAVAGEPIEFAITVINHGPSHAENVVLMDVLPDGLADGTLEISYPGCTAGTPGNENDPMVCQLGDMQAGDTIGIVISGVVDPGYLWDQESDLIKNDAMITSDMFDPDTSQNRVTTVTTIVAVADLSLEKSLKAITLPGDVVVFYITVENAGPSNAEYVTVSDIVPDGMVDMTWTCKAYGGATCRDSGVGSIDEVVSIPVGGRLVYTVQGLVTVFEPIVNMATVTPPDDVTDPDTDDGTDDAVNEPHLIYLPLISKQLERPFPPLLPDLVVESILAKEYNLKVTIRNQGTISVTQPFWVDLYVQPRVIPNGPNQTWDILGFYGLVWGVYGDVLPIAPGETLELIIGDDYFWPSYSKISWPLEYHTLVYAQVDSYAVGSEYGAILENHEQISGHYNNIFGPKLSGYSVEGARPPYFGEDPFIGPLPHRDKYSEQ